MFEKLLHEEESSSGCTTRSNFT